MITATILGFGAFLLARRIARAWKNEQIKKEEAYMETFYKEYGHF